MGRMLDRGFTTVRDIGGADFGIKEAQREGLVRGPRLFMGGKALSQTGGHGDMRGPGRNVWDPHYCCPIIARVADGVDEVRRAARDEIRRGADHIKIMVSGGVASPTDRIDSTQYSMDEIRAIVEEAVAANRYVAAHAYTAKAILRALEGGVRSIEHANLMDESVVDALKEHDAFVTMNLVTYWALQEEGRRHGLPEVMYRKIEAVLDGGVKALKLCHDAGIIPAYGSDLLGGMQRHQSKELTIRAEHVPAIDVIRSATSQAAKLLRDDRLGRLTPGAYGDLLVVDDDPLEDMAVLGDARIRTVVQEGRAV
ncbi:metal-dependent hydrolase family protein [Mariniluteicoccus endophyticus]